MADQKVLVTGASGYVGSRLVPELLKKKYSVRAISREPEKLERFSWSDHDQVELTKANALEKDSLERACQGCDLVYYLIHSMGQGSGDFEEADRRAAENMARAAENASVERIVFLGGHRPEAEEDELSKHRRSRLEVENALASGTVPVTVFRAAMIVGSGSASFEMLRYSLERLPPLIVTHPYANDETQPIAISDVLTYLVECLEEKRTIGESYDIGGPDVLSNRNVMKTYARVAGLPEPTIVSSTLIPLKMVSFSTYLLTPLPWELVDPLVLGARHPSVCSETRIRDIIPQDLMSLETAMTRAHEKSRLDIADETTEDFDWPSEWPRSGDPDWSGGVHYEDRRSMEVDADVEEVWETIVEIGSRNALFFAAWFRNLVGWVDSFLQLFNFPERPVPDRPVQKGDYLDCWRILEQERPTRIKLYADVDLPGEPVLEFRLNSSDGTTELTQIARFRPRGLKGRIYWRVLSVFHLFSFPMSLRSIARRTETANI